MIQEKPNLEALTLADELVAKLPEGDRKKLYRTLLEAYSTGLSYGAEMGRSMGSNELHVEEVRGLSRKVIAYLQARADKEVHIELYIR